MMKKSKSKRIPLIVNDIIINETLFQKYLSRKNEKKVKALNDLSELNTRTESELLKILNQMVKTKNFFKYCSSLLININPGPNYIKDYLNLQTWLQSTSSKNESTWQPHLYSFMYFVYKTMIKEQRDQVVNLLGPIGSGKTFNIVHIIEYFCCMVGPNKYQVEIFDTIHKSIQLVHMMGSIYRENNIESTSCGMLLKLGFDDNNLISSFDLEAKILDYTLPFSENGRSFSILHAFMTGAKLDLKRKFGIPEKEHSLNFFRKFANNFTESTKQRFKLNDLEIWNRFHSLMKFFQFSKEEVIDVLSLISYILNLNELIITKIKIGKLKNVDAFTINQGVTTKKLSKNLSIDEEEFIKNFGQFYTIEEAKTFIISMMKKTYFILFEFIITKVKNYLKGYFINLSRQLYGNTNLHSKKKYIHFIDFPGEVEDMTLGGFTTNIANECLNMYAASGYYEVVEKLLKESVLLNNFLPLKSYSVIQTSFGPDGFFDYFSLPFTKENFYKLYSNTTTKKHYKKCVMFNETKDFDEIDFGFQFQFSHQQITYNYQTLYCEAKALVPIQRINQIYSLSSNSIISSTYRECTINHSTDFASFFISNLRALFDPIRNLKPFVVYCLHSNNSYKIFFNQKKPNRKNSNSNIKKEEYDEIPNEVTMSIIKNSLAFPILNWDWYGYKEWMEIDQMVKEYCNDFEKVKDKIVLVHNSNENKEKFKDIPFKNLDNKNKVCYTMSILARENDYIIGKKYVIMKKGTLLRMRNYLNSMIATVEEINAKTIKSAKSNYNSNNTNKIVSGSRGDSIRTTKRNIGPDVSDLPQKKTFNLENEDTSRSALLKSQCILNIIEDDKIVNNKSNATNTNKYNIYEILDRRENTSVNKSYIDTETYDDEKETSKTKSNVIVSDRSTFYKLKSLLDPTKNKNFNIFDYQEFEPFVIRLQKNVRALIARKKYKVLEYLNYEITLIQKHVRQLITRKKFLKFVDCYNKICFIQRCYHERYLSMNSGAIKIQSAFRGYLRYIRMQNKLNERQAAFDKGEYWEFENSSDDDGPNNYELERNLQKISTNRTKREKLPTKGISKTKLLQEEKDPNKIIRMLLLDGDLGEDDHKLLINKNNPFKYRQRGNNDGIAIEDKLIAYGKKQQQKRTQAQLDKIKAEEEKMPFKPTISKNINLNEKYPNDFLKRMEYYKLFKERNIEILRNNQKKKTMNNNTFKPKISSFAQTIRRNFNLLYNEEQIKKKEKAKQVYTTSFPMNNSSSNNNQISTVLNNIPNTQSKKEDTVVSRKLMMLLEENKEDIIPNDNSYQNEPQSDSNEIWPEDYAKLYAKEIE